MKKEVAVVAIDMQNCFADLPGAPLPVPGAVSDMRRFAEFITRNRRHIDGVYATLDTHPFNHISHANRWVNAVGEQPQHFTIISHQEMLDGDWSAANFEDQTWQLEYLKRLKRPHYIWPIHGQTGTWEHQVQDDVAQVLAPMGAKVHFIQKGMHPDTEQFGVFGAEVPYPGAPETDINQRLINVINEYDRVIFAGEASSHCVMDSVNQFLDHIPSEDAWKVIVFEDCMSPVAQAPGGPDFPAQAEEWLNGLAARGVNVTTSTNFTF